MARNAGDHAEARAFGERGLAASRALGDEYGMAASLNGLCMTAIALGDLEAAVDFGRESAAWARGTGDRRALGASLTNLGQSLRSLDRLDEAERTLRESLAAFREGEDPRGEASAPSGLAVVAGWRGDPNLARSLAGGALAIYERLGLLAGQLDVLDIVASLELAAGRPAAALRLLTVARRERDAGRLGEPAVSPDRRADRAAPLPAVVAEVLLRG